MIQHVFKSVKPCPTFDRSDLDFFLHPSLTIRGEIVWQRFWKAAETFHPLLYQIFLGMAKHPLTKLKIKSAGQIND